MTSTLPLPAQRWQPKFFALFATQALSQIGSNVVQFALIWFITQRSGSATALATAALMGLLPQVILGPFAGALVDRWNRKCTMLVADATSMACAALLAYGFAMGRVDVWHIYALMFVRSCCGAFQWPAMSASTALLVPSEHLARVSGFNQMLQGGSTIIAPPVAAALMAVLPMHGMMLVDVLTAMPALLLLAVIAIPQPIRQKATGKTSLWADLREGGQFLFGNKGLLILAFIAMLMNFLLMPTGALAPLMITQKFNGAAADLAMFESAFGIALILGGLLLSVWGGFKKRVNTILLFTLFLGAGVLLIGVAPRTGFVWVIAGNALAGFVMPLINGSAGAIFQSVIPNNMQGRVTSLIGSVGTLVAPLGLVISGPLSDKVGLEIWYILSGVACVGVCVFGFLSKPLMQLEEKTNQ